MNKKGQLAVFLLIIFIVTAIVLTIGFLDKSISKGTTSFIGEEQLRLLQTYQDSEKDLFYIDQSAKYSVNQALLILSENGGFNPGDLFERYNSYALWSNNPGFKKNFETVFNEQMARFLDVGNISKLSYELYVNGNEVVGFSDKNLIRDIEYKATKSGKLAVVPSFRYKPDFRIDIFDNIATFKQQFLDCKMIKSIDEKDCIKQRVNQFNTIYPDFEMKGKYFGSVEGIPYTGDILTMTELPDDKMFLFDVTSKRSLIGTAGGRSRFVTPVIKFAFKYD